MVDILTALAKGESIAQEEIDCTLAEEAINCVSWGGEYVQICVYCIDFVGKRLSIGVVVRTCRHAKAREKIRRICTICFRQKKECVFVT